MCCFVPSKSLFQSLEKQKCQSAGVSCQGQAGKKSYREAEEACNIRVYNAGMSPMGLSVCLFEIDFVLFLFIYF